jgi:hypothetical protein
VVPLKEWGRRERLQKLSARHRAVLHHDGTPRSSVWGPYPSRCLISGPSNWLDRYFHVYLSKPLSITN